MIRQSGAVLRLALLCIMRPPATLLAIGCWGPITPIAKKYRKFALSLTLVASALSAASVDCHDLNTDTTSPMPVRNETVVYRQTRTPELIVGQESVEHPYTEQFEASDELESGDVSSKYSIAVQIVRYVNPDGRREVDSLASVAADSTPNEFAKAGGLIALRPGDDARIGDEKESSPPRERATSIMDQIDDYLWDVYQRIPLKKDGTGDFTWKDPAAAEHMGLSLRDYVIGGMDPQFREQLYYAGHAMDSAGLQWSMLSAFRDDYRQGLASGYKAGVSNSLHGGSRRTGGYGHGRAIDITGPEGKESEVWKWIDGHGAKYGLRRPLPKADPAHVQQVGDSHTITLALRERRSGSATVHKSKALASPGKAKLRNTAAVASER
jgi:hypothetical protein